MLKRILPVLAILVLCFGMMALPAFADDSVTGDAADGGATGVRALSIQELDLQAEVPATQVKKVVYVNQGKEPSFTIECTNLDGKKWIEVYQTKGPLKEGDPKPEMGVVKDSKGNVWGIIGIQTIDADDQTVCYKDSNGNWVVKGRLYLGGKDKPAVGEQTQIMLETGTSYENMTLADPVMVTIPAEGESVTVDVGNPDSKTVAPPVANDNLVYNRHSQNGVHDEAGFSLKDHWGTDAGKYTATATLDEGYTWTDGTTAPKQIAWEIKPATVVKVEVDQAIFPKDGKEHKPNITKVTADNNVELTSDEYTVEFPHGATASYYSMEVTGKGNFTGTAMVALENCDHTRTDAGHDKTWVPTSAGKHAQKCGHCKTVLTSTEEACTSDGHYASVSLDEHKSTCVKCGGTILSAHKLGQRNFYKWKKFYGTLYLWYTQDCRDNCGLKVDSQMPCPRTTLVDEAIVNLVTLLNKNEAEAETAFLNALTAGKVNLDDAHKEWESAHSFLSSMGYSFSSVMHLVTFGFAGGQYDVKLTDKDLTTMGMQLVNVGQLLYGSPVESTAYYRDANTGEYKKVPLDTKYTNGEKMNAQALGTQAVDIEGDIFTYYDVSGLSTAERESIVVLANAPQLEAQVVGDHTMAMLAVGLDADGNALGTSAEEFDYTVSEAKDPETGETVHVVGDLAHANVGSADEGTVVMTLSASTVDWTDGVASVAAPTAKLSLVPTAGGKATALAETDYTLKCYKVEENDVDGVFDTEVLKEVDKGALTGVGLYRLVATPTEGAAWTGPVEAQFQVAVPDKPDLESYKGKALAAGFTDLDLNAWYMGENGMFPGTDVLYLDYAVGRGLMSGYKGTTLFGPNDAMSRAMVATVIYRMATGATADEPYATENTSGLSDVEPGQWYTAAVNWCVEHEVITGYKSGPDAGKFCPGKDTTREELATITGRYCTKVAGKPSASAAELERFSDKASISEFAREGVAFCVANKIVGGYTDGTNRFDPQGNALRCQGAKIFAVTALLVDEK